MFDDLQKLSEGTKETIGGLLLTLLGGITVAVNRWLALRKQVAKTKTVEAEEETKQTKEELETETHNLTISSLKLQQTLTGQAQKYIDDYVALNKELAKKEAELEIINKQLAEQQRQIKDLQEILNKRIIVSAEGCSFLIRPLVSSRSLVPFIVLDEADATLSFTGDSYLDNLEDHSVYSHVVSSIDTYFKTPMRDQLDIVFRLDSYGSTSKKWIAIVCEKGQEWANKGKAINVAWHVDKSDEAMLDDVGYFMDGLTVPYTIKNI